jgi:catechol 2,3-dioxygenase-like lactoylglutathione lyase family enzyme
MPVVSRILESYLWVKDAERAAEFYKDLFGFEVIGRSSEPGRLVALSVGGSQVLLLGKVGASTQPSVTPGGIIPPTEGSGNSHVAFPIAAAELEAWGKRLAEKGIPVESEVKWERGGQSLYFRDPDGNLLELITPGAWTIY